jgi:hypothetical protein
MIVGIVVKGKYLSDGGIVSRVGNAFLIYTRVHTP